LAAGEDLLAERAPEVEVADGDDRQLGARVPRRGRGGRVRGRRAGRDGGRLVRGTAPRRDERRDGDPDGQARRVGTWERGHDSQIYHGDAESGAGPGPPRAGRKISA